MCRHDVVITYLPRPGLVFRCNPCSQGIACHNQAGLAFPCQKSQSKQQGATSCVSCSDIIIWRGEKTYLLQNQAFLPLHDSHDQTKSHFEDACRLLNLLASSFVTHDVPLQLLDRAKNRALEDICCRCCSIAIMRCHVHFFCLQFPRYCYIMSDSFGCPLRHVEQARRATLPQAM